MMLRKIKKKEKRTAAKGGPGSSYILSSRKDLVFVEIWDSGFGEMKGKTLDEVQIEVQTKCRSKCG